MIRLMLIDLFYAVERAVVVGQSNNKTVVMITNHDGSRRHKGKLLHISKTDIQDRIAGDPEIIKLKFSIK